MDLVISLSWKRLLKPSLAFKHVPKGHGGEGREADKRYRRLAKNSLHPGLDDTSRTGLQRVSELEPRWRHPFKHSVQVNF